MHVSLLLTDHPTPSDTSTLTNNDLAVLGEVVGGDLEVQRRRSLSYAARDVVVGAVARAEPASKVTSLANGHASQVRADAQHDEPLGLLDALRVGLGVAQGFPLGVFGLLDFRVGAVADEDGLASPFDNDLMCVSGCCGVAASVGGAGRRTFLPSGMAARSISTLAWASTSAEADMLTRKSGGRLLAGALSITRDPRLIRKIANCCSGGARSPFLAALPLSSRLASRRGVEASYLARSPSRQAQTARPWCRP
jgi:hypothetical protein